MVAVSRDTRASATYSGGASRSSVVHCFDFAMAGLVPVERPSRSPWTARNLSSRSAVNRLAVSSDPSTLVLRA